MPVGEMCWCIYRYDDPEHPFFFWEYEDAKFVYLHIDQKYRDQYAEPERCPSPFMDPCEAVDRINFMEHKYGAGR